MSLSCNEHDIVSVTIYENTHRRLTTVRPIQALQTVLNLRVRLESDKSEIIFSSLRFCSRLRMAVLEQRPL
jgi:hypothetical protein